MQSKETDGVGVRVQVFDSDGGGLSGFGCGFTRTTTAGGTAVVRCGRGRRGSRSALVGGGWFAFGRNGSEERALFGGLARGVAFEEEVGFGVRIGVRVCSELVVCRVVEFGVETEHVGALGRGCFLAAGNGGGLGGGLRGVLWGASGHVGTLDLWVAELCYDSWV